VTLLVTFIYIRKKVIKIPAYDLKCESCNKVYEIQMKIAEYIEQKDKLQCQECHGKLSQVPAPLRFKLQGNGWFSSDYGITDMETSSNLDMEKKIEDRFNDASVRDKNIKEL